MIDEEAVARKRMRILDYLGTLTPTSYHPRGKAEYAARR